MIRNRDVAKEIAELMLDIGAKLDASKSQVQMKCSSEEAESYETIVAGIMAQILADVMNPLYAQHPDLKPTERSIDDLYDATRKRIREIEQRALKKLRIGELDARDQLLFTLWRDDKIGYEDALIYATSPFAVQLAISEERRRRRDDGGLSAGIVSPAPPKGPSPLTSSAPIEGDERNK